MNKYNENDYANALECMKKNKYSKETKNLFFYAPVCYREDMYSDFEENPEFGEEEFRAKYKKVVYCANFKR